MELTGRSPNAEQQNAVAEVGNKTLDQGTMAIMEHGQQCRPYLWDELQDCFVFVHAEAAVILKNGKRTSRRCLFEGNNKLFDQSLFRVPLCLSYIYVKKRLQHGTYDKKAIMGVFVGYSRVSLAYRILDLEARKVREVAHQFCICHEGKFPFKASLTWNVEEKEQPPTYLFPKGEVPTIGGSDESEESEDEIRRNVQHRDYSVDLDEEDEDIHRQDDDRKELGKRNRQLSEQARRNLEMSEHPEAGPNVAHPHISASMSRDSNSAVNRPTSLSRRLNR